MKSRLVALDRRLLELLRTRFHSATREAAARWYALAGEYGVGWTALALLGAARERSARDRWLAAATLVPATLSINYLLKQVVRRPRPVLEDLPPLGRAPRTSSFPSAHAATSFCGAQAISTLRPSLRLPLLSAAALMALTRPYLGLHYPSDAAAGALLGVAIGEFGSRASRAWSKGGSACR